jgi:4-hydroxybenzoate polyprenyltransferase
LWIYQGERFPVFKNGILILSFSFCAVCLSSLLRGEASWPGTASALTAFVCLFLFFLQLRIADEFKDRHEDAQFRPERPVPRGLVTFNELKGLAALTMAVQVAFALWLSPRLLILLVAVWGYMALMSVEFFVPDWLKKRPFTYMWSHMLIMPLIDFYATACDWLVTGVAPPAGLPWFLVVSFFNGVIIEIGRKTWAPEQERPGVESYSSSWGIKKALSVWLIAIGLSVFCAWRVAVLIDYRFLILTTIGGLSVFAAMLAISFLKNATADKAAMLENLSGLWVAVLYVMLGVVPMLLAAGLPL